MASEILRVFYYIVFIVKSGSKFVRRILCNSFHLLSNALLAESL